MSEIRLETLEQFLGRYMGNVEAAVRDRIVKELTPRMNEILYEEAAKASLRLIQTFEVLRGENEFTIRIQDQRKSK